MKATRYFSRKRAKSEKGAALTEYFFLAVALLSIGIPSASYLGGETNTTYEQVNFGPAPGPSDPSDPTEPPGKPPGGFTCRPPGISGTLPPCAGLGKGG